MKKKAFLILEDGTVFSGESIGSEREIISEIVFNTSMTGYLEVLTDPSYAGQAVVMTYPLIGNYGITSDMESARPWPDGYIVRELSRMPSNFRSTGTIQDFLMQHEIPGIAGIDTRALTKLLREKGTMNGMITTNEAYALGEILPRLKEYRTGDVVSKVTCQEKSVLPGKGKRVALMDFGAKNNIAKSLHQRGCQVTIYPAHTPAEELLRDQPDGIMLSNGPGDPKDCGSIISEIKKLSDSQVPIFAICLGHQLMALAHGADTYKMKYGHRGGNHPVKDLETGRVYISSQNHGYVVDTDRLDPAVAVPAFVNVNDGTNEGLKYTGKPIFTVQFHPEACPGPADSGYLFDKFLTMMDKGAGESENGAVTGKEGGNSMPKNPNIKKVLVIGSGPIVIGQAAEFDYAGTQACRSLKEEGVEVVLVNSNPATIMTDKDIADKVYIEPLTVKVLEQIILKERPDSVLPTLGGQAGLNLGMELAESGFLAEHGVKLIGTTAETIFRAEDRQAFKDTMEKIGEPCAASKVVHNVSDGIAFTNTIGYPVVLRPAYTLGGSGGGIAHNETELVEILTNGLRLSRVGEVLVERCIAGWKEIEYEVMRDAAGNCITVCNMENIDPVGVHTGDSIVVAPSQTLGDKEYQMLRTSALNIISELGITGGCNVQYALHPTSFEYCVIEVNPRVSRSSALASKATGYPIAKVAAKIALGYTLDEIKNAITGKTYASFEPMLDYCVVKIPRLPFDKFLTAKRTLTTQMKATGEVMSICNNFEGALMKAIRSLEQHVESLVTDEYMGLSYEEMIARLRVVDDRRIWVIAEAVRRGVSYETIHEVTQIDLWFIDKIAILVEMEKRLRSEALTIELLREAKRLEFPDTVIAKLTGKSEETVKQLRYDNGIVGAFKMVDTCAAEFAATTPYYYSVYGSENEAEGTQNRKKVLVLGSGPIRIGQGIEFDYCSVHCTWAFSREGYETIIVNNNPETVSTDFDIADKLYFEPLTPEDVQNIVDIEKPDGAVVQFGGQTAIKLTESLMKMGVPILGTKAEDVDAAEDRKLFDQILEQTQIPRAAGGTVFTAAEAKEVANSLGYPVLVRPSYVLGGQGMQIAYTDQEIEEFMEIINRIAQDHPILVDKYLQGKEIEVDAVCDGTDILIPGIMEHIERTGVHSGDSISVYPAFTISDHVKDTIVEYTRRLAQALHVVGLINIQFIAMDEEVYVIEVNPRSSRTVPYISKVTGIPIVDLATKVILGNTLKGMGYPTGLAPTADYIAVKMPVFSFEKLRGAEISLGPEMKSTGECLGIAKTFNEALYKAFLGAGIQLPKHKQMIISVKDADKPEAAQVAKRFEALGYTIYATRSTAKYLKEQGVKVRRTNKITQESPNVMDLILGHKIDLVIDTPTQGREKSRDGFLIRRNAIETGVHCLTAMDTANALVTSLENVNEELTLVDIARVKNL